MARNLSYVTAAVVAIVAAFLILPGSAQNLKVEDPTTSSSSIIEDIKNLRVTELKNSKIACPLPVIGNPCPEQTPLYYFDCCNDLTSCCFHLQDWVIVLLAVMTFLVILSILINLIRCLVCF